MALERWKCQNNDDDFDAFLINSKILSLSFFIGIRAHLADLDMNATDYDGRMSTKQTILNSIMMMMIQLTFAFCVFKILNTPRKDSFTPGCLWGTPCLRPVTQQCFPCCIIINLFPGSCSKSVKLRQNHGIVGGTLLCGTHRCSPGASRLLIQIFLS